MSYEPTLIISRDDLRNNADNLEGVLGRLERIKKPTERITAQIRAYKELAALLPRHGSKIKDVWIVIVKPELTSHNALVRGILDDYDIEYAIDY